ncbi:signal peptidase I SipW [Ferdinandcohnia sp. Marseille-Q9671]
MKIGILKKWINNVVSVLLIAVILLMVFFLVSSKISGGTPKVFGKELLTVLSGSMEPAIQTGSIIAITPTEDSTIYKEGDVITYRSLDDPNVLITHRIMEVQEVDSSIQYITKGDNNDAKDTSPIPSSNVVGEYTDFTIPFVGYILDFVKSKIGTVLVIIVPGILLIGYAAFSVWRAIASMEDSEPESTEQTKI